MNELFYPYAKPSQLWWEAANKATAAGHKPGSSPWWAHIRETLGIARHE